MRVLQRGINNADPAFNFYVVFSDRNRFYGPADAWGIQISSISSLTIRSAMTLKSWGNAQYSVDTDLPANYAAVGKIYQGWGETIGQGSGRALHCISFNALRRSRVVLL